MVKYKEKDFKLSSMKRPDNAVFWPTFAASTARWFPVVASNPYQ